VRVACPKVVALPGHGAGAAELASQKVLTGHAEQFPAPPWKPATHWQACRLEEPAAESECAGHRVCTCCAGQEIGTGQYLNDCTFSRIRHVQTGAAAARRRPSWHRRLPRSRRRRRPWRARRARIRTEISGFELSDLNKNDQILKT
jgi:hypothetical protein